MASYSCSARVGREKAEDEDGSLARPGGNQGESEARRSPAPGRRWLHFAPVPRTSTPLSDSEILDILADQHRGDLAVEACIAECRAALGSDNLTERLALTKKLAYAVTSAPTEPPRISMVAAAAQGYHAGAGDTVW